MKASDSFKFALPIALYGLTACSPVVKVEAPDKPIVVNMNVKIEHTLKVKIKKDLDQTIKNNPDIF
jgi:YnbE-like lipoprotein